jgi:hypothetical protein
MTQVERHAVDVVVLGNLLDIWAAEQPFLKELVVRNGYVRVATLGDTEIYKLPAGRR